MKEHLSGLKEFLKSPEFRHYLISSAIGLILFVVMGCISYLTNPAKGDELIAQFMAMVSEASVIDPETGTISVFVLLQNNWIAMLIMILYGLIPFIQFPVISLFSNGLLVGIMAGMYWVSDEMTMPLFLAGLVPHGIFEFTALVVAVACGRYLCRNTTKMISRKHEKPEMSSVFTDLLRVLLFVIAPLTVVAAFVEVYLTPVVQALFV